MAFDRRRHRISFYVLTILGALCAGILGGVLSQSLFIDDINDILPTAPVIITDQQVQTPVEQARFADALRPSVLRLHSRAKNPEQSFTERTAIGYGAALTADGWLIAPRTTLPIADILVVDWNRTAYPVLKRVDDSAIGVSYLKVAASQWRPVIFNADAETISNTSAYLMKDWHSFAPIQLSALTYRPVIEPRDFTRTTEQLDKVFNPRDIFTENGQPVFTIKREFAGLATSTGIIPASYMRRSANAAIRQGVHGRITTDIRYVDTAHAVVLSTSIERSVRGATLTAGQRIALVASPRQELLGGDTVTSVNDERLSANRSLSELLHQYAPGDTVTITFTRAGISKTAKLLLK